MRYIDIIIPFAGGLGMFIYGMQIMAQGLEHAAGNKMKKLLEALTKNKFLGVFLGAFITAVIQSSSATTVMVVGFVNAGIMDLTQAMGVIMGANVGTTITGWLVAAGEWADILKPSTIAPIAIVAGVITMLAGKRHSSKDAASIFVGFGLLFIGISTMSDAVKPLQQSEAFRSLFISLGTNPVLGIFAGALVTAVIQSSSASVGILQSLAGAGLVPFQAAVYIIMGQNIGTCVTAILSAIGAKKNAKTAALMHLLFNILGTVIFSVGFVLFFSIIKPVWGYGAITQTQISGIHTAFNIATTILLFPVSGWIIQAARKISGAGKDTERETVVSLDTRMLETPPLALQATITEVGHMGILVKETLEVAAHILLHPNREEIKKVQENENIVDQYCHGITEYALQITGLQVSDKEHQSVARLVQVVSDLERVGDYCENLSEFAETILGNNLVFSEHGAGGLKEMLDVCVESYQYAIEALIEENQRKAKLSIEKERESDELEVVLRSKHIKRLTNGECSTEAGIVFLDALVCLERIADHARNIAEEVLSHTE